MDARFIRTVWTYLRNDRYVNRYLLIPIIVMLAPTSLAALPFGVSVETGWMVMQTKYDLDSASAYGENRPLIGIGVRGVLLGISAGIDAAFTPHEPSAFVYDADGRIDSFESGLYSNVIASERLSYLRYSFAVGHAFDVAAFSGVTIRPALELFALHNLAYTSGSIDLVQTWPIDVQEDVRNALDGVYVGLSGTVGYRVGETISVGARFFAARAVAAKIFPGSRVRAPDNADPRRNAWIEIGASVTFTIGRSQ